ncbi:glutathione S-transferase [Pseudomassariella vexata]|uniref:Glutathione S-transferase n=1 Tax=Pseudomassariella vexata TaxID=1141098 RepID=A0A1Y2EGY8_9PEZI|nr:glutathione S-transferase [Pseudomassariella vexata]ORY70055.1 glutathione S-transferase [Pseudomassariella vexata]
MATEDQPKIKLYWLEKSRAQSILWLFEELKLNYELELFHRNKDNMLAPPELKQVHALGKSPVVTVTPAGSEKPIVLAETGFIAQYMSEHFAEGTNLVPTRYKAGQEGKSGGETEAWLRWQYFLHYNEGSLVSLLMMAMVLGALKGPKVPFFIRPITAMVSNQIISMMIFPNAKAHLGFLENQLATSGGDYLCGDHLTTADIVLSFALINAKDSFKGFGNWGKPLDQLYPKLWAWIDRMEAEPGYQRSVKKIKDIDDSFGIKFP